MEFQILDPAEVKGPKQRFLSELPKRYPHLSEEIEDNDGLLHLNMSTFQRHVEKLCAERKLSEIRECFEWLNTYLVEGHLDILNAINVSFLEYFGFQEGLSEEEFIDAMPDTLYRAYVEHMEYMHRLAKFDYE